MNLELFNMNIYNIIYINIKEYLIDDCERSHINYIKNYLHLIVDSIYIFE